MAAAAPELEPFALELVDALPVLGELAGLLFVVGCIYMVDAFVRSLFGTVSGAVGWIPWIGKVVSAPIHSIEQKVTSALGSAEASIDNHIGTCFHKLASLLEHMGVEILGLGLLGVALAAELADHLRHLIGHDAAIAANQAEAAAAHRIATEAEALARSVGAAATSTELALRHRIGALEGEVAGVLEPDIAGLRDRAHEIEDALGRAWDLIRQHEEALGIGAITGAVAVALAELDLSWTRCASNNLVGKKLCGLGPELLEELLGTAIASMAIGDVCQIVTAIVTGVDDLQPVLDLMIAGVDDLLKCQGSERPPHLPYVVPALPPLQTPAALSAAA